MLCATVTGRSQQGHVMLTVASLLYCAHVNVFSVICLWCICVRPSSVFVPVLCHSLLFTCHLYVPSLMC